MRFYRLLVLVICVSFVSACEAPSSIENEKAKNSTSSSQQNNQVKPSNSDFDPFYVYKDKGSRMNHYVPSGFMPNGNCIKMDDSWTELCHEGRTCIRFDYDTECSRQDQKWAGVYWLNPANNWGSRKGGYNLSGATRFVFWARGENGGEQIQEFTIGGISGDYPDTDTAVMGPVILSNEWREYSIDLRGKDLSYISGGFSWTTAEEVNQEDVIFYIDEARFE